MNKLLASLSKLERTRVATLMEQVDLCPGEVLFEPQMPIQHVYFPMSGIISLVVVLEDGLLAEICRIGNEGMAGLPLLFGVRVSQTRAFVQMRGEALRMKARIFRKEIQTGRGLSKVLLRYVPTLMGHTERLTACNTWHTIEQRLARWLLITNDRLRTDVVEVTQESLAQVFGAHRQSVNLAAGNLQRAGLIRYSRGKLTILDRDGLEGAACECYGAIQHQFKKLFADIGR